MPPTLAIIGAGFGGIGMAIRLKQAGYHDFAMYERAADLGGVWRDNTYPGAACDVPSHLYSFSFEPKPDWSRRYATQPEILGYLRHCVDAYGLAGHLRFGCGVATAEFDARRARWVLTTDSGERVEADVVVSACGQLRTPAWPDLPGIDDFGGAAFHTARWNHDVDLVGKRVAVIGTGASAIQVIPSIVDSVAELRVFQRTPPYVISRGDRPYPERSRRWYTRLPVLQKISRAKLFLQLETRVLGFAHAPRLLRGMEAAFRRKLRRQVLDPDRRAALTPRYRIGCKRVLVSDDFYPALERPHTRLVTEAIERVEPAGVRTVDGQCHDVDVIVYATGFRAQEFVAPMRVFGRHGHELARAWDEGAQAHLGITVSGFPNFFLLYGPNTNLGHNSIIYMLESQLAYVLDAVRRLDGDRLRYLDVRDGVQRGFAERIQRSLRRTVFGTGCSSWYLDAHGRNANNWPGSVLGYRRLTRAVALHEYEAPVEPGKPSGRPTR